jgi:hypothetical protein
VFPQTLSPPATGKPSALASAVKVRARRLILLQHPHCTAPNTPKLYACAREEMLLHMHNQYGRMEVWEDGRVEEWKNGRRRMEVRVEPKYIRSRLPYLSHLRVLYSLCRWRQCFHRHSLPQVQKRSSEYQQSWREQEQ